MRALTGGVIWNATEPTGAPHGPGVAFPPSGGGPGENGAVRAGPGPVAAVALTAVVALLAGCTDPPAPPAKAATPVAASAAPLDARVQLAGRIAAAKDRRYVAGYTLVAGGRPARAVTVTIAADRTWRVDVQGGALGGTADISVVGVKAGRFQCSAAGCVKVATADAPLPAAVDPRVQYAFVDWLRPLSDPRAALSVATAPALPGVKGACYSVEPTAASLLSPVDPGIYCYDADGTLTGARVGFGTLTLAGGPAAAPPTVALPAPVTGGPALGMAAPPPPPSPSAVSSPPAGRRGTPSPTRR
jgi:hypothetical protein